MIALGCDLAGIELMQGIKKYLDTKNIEYTFFGPNNKMENDYPLFAKGVVYTIFEGKAQSGILICGTGIGVSVAANRYKGIRAALCHDTFSAKASREHNNANILAMGARVIGKGLALDIIDIFLNTQFPKEERHVRRIKMLDEQQ